MELEKQKIQGIIISGYRDLHYSKYFFLQICDRNSAKAWLAKVLPLITNSEKKNVNFDQAMNIAFTYTGLQKLELPDAVLETFSQEFIEGMANPNRLRQLGDVGESRCDQWEPVWQQRKVHVLLMVQAKTKQVLEQVCQEARIQFEQWGLRLEAEETGYQDLKTAYEAQDDNLNDASSNIKFYEGKEHFGFRDGISQPEIEGKRDPKGAETKPTETKPTEIKAGEFILGYRNEDGNFPPMPTLLADKSTKCPVQKILSRLKTIPAAVSSLLLGQKQQPSGEQELKDFGCNGSYLVFRKLSQDVAGFRQYFNKFDNPDLMQAKVVGRWASGAPLTLSPTQDNPALATANNFSYAESDAHGYGCPFGAHIRRANPRDSLDHDAKESIQRSNRHRILRRGALYGQPLPEGVLEDDGNDRGLLFFCINANIRRQFEFVQQTWLNNPKFNGFDDEADPLIAPKKTSMTLPNQLADQQIKDLPSFVTVKGGEYFFLPSIAALHVLVNCHADNS